MSARGMPEGMPRAAQNCEMRMNSMDVQWIKQWSELPWVGPFVVPAAFVVGGLALGLVFDRFILWELKRIASRTKWQGDEILVDALRGAPLLWFLLAGIYGALEALDVAPEVDSALKKALLVLAVLSVTWVAARAVAGFVQLYSRSVGGIMLSTSMFPNVMKAIVVLIGLLIALQSLGISIAPLLTALGVGGLAVALALQDTLSNLFSGIHVIASKQVRPGDYVKLDSGGEGYVTDVTWRYTTIRALPNNLIVVPNAKLASAIVTNFSLPEAEMAVLVEVGVSYGSDLERVERVTCEVARETMKAVPGGIPAFEPFIRYHTFSDFSINFTAILRCGAFVDQYLVKHEFVKRLHRRYGAEGIEIPFPIRTVHLSGPAGEPGPPAGAAVAEAAR